MNTDSIKSVEKLLRAVAQSIADYEDEVEVNAIATDNEITFFLRVHSLDLAKNFAMNGRTVRALRLFISAAGAKNCHHFSL